MANIILRLSTGSAGQGATNGVTDNSLGGGMGTDAEAVITTANTSLNNLFDNVSKLENSNSTTDYRCVYIHNDTPTSGDIFGSGVVYLQGSPKANIRIGIGLKNTETLVIAEETNEADVTLPNMSAPTELSPLQISADDLLDIGDWIPLWIERKANNVAGSGTVTDVISLVVRGIE